ncbi:MAG: MFS transporter [Bacteroidetes bacterium GWF2_42_66]|nr:MAG: MFS transporter [Bacteroidetes bacterium GWA2_42_15]OFX96352.1 MAG: MFS transporter [Bacteroidetes bacterium GWE2_42_39]OFY46391.1 MAG: MFS transporter [Bacteroidetes bacterium GWF2_42_66]HBL78223.1 MFS transporter [Prolixibacteraceae bacterium]HCR89939.1 MFS transporter [Prolixibacteraceae bacterium]
MTSKIKSFYPWVVVALLWGVALLNYMDRQMLSTMKVAMMGDIRELETAENFGRLMAVFLWIYGFASPFAGLIADRINRKWLIVGSLAVWSGVTLAMGYAQTFDQLYVLRALMGISEALYIPAGLALIADYHKGTTRSLAIGIHITGLYMGQALGGFGATVAHIWSWQQTFHTFGLAGILYSIILILFLKEKRDTVMKSGEKTGSSGLRSVKHSLGMLLGTLSFWVILYYFAAPSFPGWAVKNWIPTLFAESLHIDMSFSGPLSTITIAASSFVGVIFGGILSDRWITRNLRGRIYTGAIGLGLTIPAIFMIGLGQGFIAVIMGAIMFGIGFGMFDANNMPILCQFVSSRHRAAGYGLMNMIGVFGGAMITNFLGKSTDSGNLGRDMAMLSIPVAIAIVLQLTMLKPKVADKQED